MPIINGRDKNGPYYKFGVTGTKYYYTPKDPISRAESRALAAQQGRAIERSKALRKSKSLH